MEKQRWLSLLTAGTLLVSAAAVPAYAAPPDDDYGGLAITQPTPSTRREPTEAPPADDVGGLAGTSPTPSNRRLPTEPMPEDDVGGLASTSPTPSNRRLPTSPMPGDDNGGLASPTVSGKGPIINNNRGQEEDGSGEAEPAEEPGEILAGVTLDASRHGAYVLGSSGKLPTFRPSSGMTRAEAAVILSRLLPQDTVLPPGASYSDVPADAWYAQAVGTMGALGVMRPGEAEFQPGAAVTRGEFLRYVASFFPLREDAELFRDVPGTHENAAFIRSARAYGWVRGGSDGTFQPDQPLTRAAAVTILNSALGRTADKNYIDLHHPAFYVDVAPDAWYYYDIMEASVAHTHTDNGSERWTAHTARTEVPAEGLQLADGWLYYYDAAQGDIARNRSVGNFAFNAAGHFTSGNTELDGKLRAIVLAQTNGTMSREEMLRALYLYTRDSFKYLRRPAYAMGANDFMVTDALRILNTGYGNCYCYASLFWFLSRWIGYDAVIYSGTVGQNRAPHSWVEIKFDEKWYIFDAELEMAYRRRGRTDINLYKYIDVNNGWRYVRPRS